MRRGAVAALGDVGHGGPRLLCLGCLLRARLHSDAVGEVDLARNSLKI